MEMSNVDFDIKIEGEAVMIMVITATDLEERLEVTRHIQKELDLCFEEQGLNQN